MKFNVIPSQPTEGIAQLELSERVMLHDAFVSFFVFASLQQLPDSDDHNEKIMIGAELLISKEARGDFHKIPLYARKAELLAEVIEVYASPTIPEHEERILKLAKSFRAASERLALNLAPGFIVPMSDEEIDLVMSDVVIPETPATWTPIQNATLGSGDSRYRS